jgi:hypothetical protein
VLHRQQQQ